MLNNFNLPSIWIQILLYHPNISVSITVFFCFHITYISIHNNYINFYHHTHNALYINIHNILSIHWTYSWLILNIFHTITFQYTLLQTWHYIPSVLKITNYFLFNRCVSNYFISSLSHSRISYMTSSSHYHHIKK